MYNCFLLLHSWASHLFKCWFVFLYTTVSGLYIIYWSHPLPSCRIFAAKNVYFRLFMLYFLWFIFHITLVMVVSPNRYLCLFSFLLPWSHQDRGFLYMLELTVKMRLGKSKSYVHSTNILLLKLTCSESVNWNTFVESFQYAHFFSLKLIDAFNNRTRPSITASHRPSLSSSRPV